MARDPFPKDDFSTLVRHLPAYARLAWSLGHDPRLSRNRRIALLAAAGYVVSPIDLVPGVIPVLGQLDDVVVALTALRFALSGLPAEDRIRYVTAAGLTEQDLVADRRIALATAAWIARAGIRLTARLAVGASRGIVRAIGIGAGAAAGVVRRRRRSPSA